MAASLDQAGLYTPPRHRRPQNTAPARLAALAEGVFVERADRLLTDAVLAVLADRHRGRPVDDGVVYDLLVALLAVLFPERYEAADPDAPDLPSAALTDMDRQAAADGPTEMGRRRTIARENGRAEPAGLVPAGGSVERVGVKQLAALAERLRRG